MTTAFPLKGVSSKTLQDEAAMGATIPFWTGTTLSPFDGNAYIYSIVGKNPMFSNTTTKLMYVPIVLVIKYPDGTVLDPTKPGCYDTVPVEDRFFQGPNFVPTDLVSNGINVGKTQLGDGFQRAEFWKILQGPNYHTILASASAAASAIVVHVNAPFSARTEAGVCPGSNHRIGLLSLLWYRYEIQKIAEKYATTSQVPLIVTYNALLTVLTAPNGGCCYLGYHEAFQRSSGGTQVLATGTYNDKLIFPKPIEDIDVMTHEIGEVLNDPFGNNPTPAWGHVGQVTGCQSNLEVGDPLTGTAFTLYYNHFIYHPQELAFFSWFYRTPSTGTGNLYSFEGTFKTPQGSCS
jgi:hypothetical protein